MKKYLLVIFLFMCLIMFNKINRPKVVEAFIEDKNEYYNSYTVDMNDCSLSKYKNIFINMDWDLYLISDIKLVNNYNDYILEEINNIKIKNNNYIDSLNEFIEKCIIILEEHNLDNEISKLRSGNFKIDKIVIYTTEDIYNIVNHSLNT